MQVLSSNTINKADMLSDIEIVWDGCVWHRLVKAWSNVIKVITVNEFL